MILDLNEDHSENIPYSHPEYFLFIEEDRLSQYPGYMALSHWHSEVEFVVVFFGELDYNVNGRRRPFRQFPPAPLWLFQSPPGMSLSLHFAPPQAFVLHLVHGTGICGAHPVKPGPFLSAAAYVRRLGTKNPSGSSANARLPGPARFSAANLRFVLRDLAGTVHPRARGADFLGKALRPAECRAGHGDLHPRPLRRKNYPGRNRRFGQRVQKQMLFFI